MGEEVEFFITGAEVMPKIKMPTSATILQLKEKIEEYTGVPVARQILTYHKETQLIDFHTIKEYDFVPITGILLTIETDPNQMDVNITVICPVFKVSLKVNQMDTVFNLKQKIGEMFGIETKDITLRHLSRRMQDEHALNMYYINEGSDVEFTRTGSST